MNDLAELKQFVVAHAISQSLPADHYSAVLDRIESDPGDEPGSWPWEWIRAGEELDAAGDTLAACQYFNLGRFPFVDGPGRQRAQDRCVETFDRWRSAVPVIQPETVTVDGVPTKIWTAGLSADHPRPLLVMTGGIVSTKEQWAPVLTQIAEFGMAGVVAELPGVGENRARYDADSWRLFPAVLDALADRAEVGRTYLLALSFSGHLAITAAGADERIRGIVSSGPPIADFFTDPAWQDVLPRVTRDTFAHLVRVPPAEVHSHTSGWALTDERLRELDIPLAVVTASRDEIIPPGDPARLKECVKDLRLLEYDDVHGAPSHLAEVRLWSLLSVLEMREDSDANVRSRLAAALASLRAEAS
ncbi:alpha/beta fold hydrolase [Amycolatopsis sp. GM8]|uniref:alpha/beta fold hydrolase n=1 Tax=Amycolatopsis sp. GM8 TaxID=2896530 RepID=UPI001F1B98BE|nr:alpha/beta hydrolase [Amycolatopsis sp. GM8]